LTEKDKGGAPEGNKNSVTHGVYSFRDHGEQALDVTGRGRFAELSELVQTKPGVLGMLQERCVQAVLMCEILESYVVTQKDSGKALVDIPILKQLPAFQNSAQRCINTLLQHMKEDPNALDAAKVLEAVKRGKEGE